MRYRETTPVVRGITTAFLITGIFTMMVLTYAATVINRRSLDPRSRAFFLYPTLTPTISPSPGPTPTPTPCLGLCLPPGISCPLGDVPLPNPSCSAGTNCCQKVTTPQGPYSYGTIYYSQTDGRWGSTPVAPGCTLGIIGCGPTTTSMIVATFRRLDYNPYNVYKLFFPSLTCSGIGLGAVTDILSRKFSMNTTVITGNIRNGVVNAVKSGKKVVLGAPIAKPNGTIVNHLTLVVAYGADNQLIFNDPLFGAGVKLEAGGYDIKWSKAEAAILPY